MIRFFREPDVLVRLGRVAATGRFLAAATGLVFVLLAAHAGIRHPGLPWLGALAAAVIAYNALNWFCLLRSSCSKVSLGHLQASVILLDVVDAAAMVGVLYFTGLSASPFFPFVLLAVLFANVLSPRRLALFSFSLIALLLLWTEWSISAGYLPVFAPLDPGTYLSGARQVAWLVSLGIGLWFVTFIRREFEAREDLIRRRQLQAQTLQTFTEEMLDNLPLGVIMLNAGGVIVRINAIAAQIADLTLPLTYRNIEHLPFFSDTGLLAYLRPVFGGASLHLESFPVTGDEGIRSMVMVHAERLQATDDPDKTGEAFVLLALADVSHRKQMEDETLEIHEQLMQAEKLTAMGQLAAGVAHELNNPLMGIVSSADFLSYLVDKGMPDTTDLKEKLGFIKTNADRIDRLGKRLLGYARPAQGDLHGVSVTDIVDDAISFTVYDAKRSGVALRSSIEADRLFVCEKNEIVQILVNLVTNAIHACEDEDGGSIVVYAQEAEDYLVLEVEDNGAGISPDVIEHIWTPFFTTKDADKGNGLGLAIVQTSVERCGGRISVRTDEGKGTCFRIEFPWEGGEPATRLA